MERNLPTKLPKMFHEIRRTGKIINAKKKKRNTKKKNERQSKIEKIEEKLRIKVSRAPGQKKIHGRRKGREKGRTRTSRLIRWP